MNDEEMCTCGHTYDKHWDGGGDCLQRINGAGDFCQCENFAPAFVLPAFVLPAFIKAMEEIGRYGFEKYGERSFQARAARGEVERDGRTTSQAIADHARAHFDAYLSHEVHDKFGTDLHQLAAVAFNAMMEAHFAGLLKPQ